MPKSSYDKLLEEWSSKWKNENLSPEVCKLINQANQDIYYGPICDGAYGDPAIDDDDLKSYPGFITAIKLITQALKDIPSDLYLDTETGEVLEHEPKGEKCEACDGNGRTIENEDEICPDCNGQCWFSPAGDWWHVERSDIRIALVGYELSNYVK